MTPASTIPPVSTDEAEHHGRGVRYLGSKTRVLDPLMEVIGDPRVAGTLVDAFCGTGVVAAAAAGRGWSVRINDHLESAVALATATLVARDEAAFEIAGSYEGAIKQINASEHVDGFFWREYSPGASERKYFTESNAQRIDAARQIIADWWANGHISLDERRLLVADLIVAAARVANTAGTYGCYLASWSSAAQRDFRLEPRTLRRVAVKRTSECQDVTDLRVSPCDTVYLDPPYTKRQYAAYYHVNETLAIGDEPIVEGVTGLRAWRHKASPFCYKATALAALLDLVKQLRAQRVLLSYSSEGHVSLIDLVDGLDSLGDVEVHELRRVGRYRSNGVATQNGQRVTEFLVDVRPDLTRFDSDE